MLQKNTSPTNLPTSAFESFRNGFIPSSNNHINQEFLAAAAAAAHVHSGHQPPHGPISAAAMAANHSFALAAHFQGAALAAALGSNQHSFGTQNNHPVNSATSVNNPPRDSYPLYPWLMSRHGRIYPHRFPGGKSIKKY